MHVTTHEESKTTLTPLNQTLQRLLTNIDVARSVQQLKQKPRHLMALL